MAYQARHRDPLLDTNMQAAIERRGKELLGIGLVGAGLAMALLLGSYVPEDPSWLSATDAPAQNLLGRIGASIASPLYITIGWGAWGLALIFAAWGLRLVFHRGEERVWGRVIFAPIAIAIAAVYASTHAPVEGWTHSFGMGGLFGDTVLGAVLGVAPVGAAFGLKLMALTFGLAMVTMGLFVLGVDGPELRAFGRWLLVGIILSYAGLMTLAGRTGSATIRAARAMQESRAARREAAAARAQAAATPQREPRVIRAAAAAPSPAAPSPAPSRPAFAQPLPEDDTPAPAAPPRKSLLARMPILSRAAEPQADPLPELVEPPLAGCDTLAAPTDERIREKIAGAISNRVRRARTLDLARAEPVLRAEPPVTAAPRSGVALSAPVAAAVARAQAAQAAQAAVRATAAPAQPALRAEPPLHAQPAPEATPAPQPAPQPYVYAPKTHAPFLDAHEDDLPEDYPEALEADDSDDDLDPGFNIFAAEAAPAAPAAAPATRLPRALVAEARRVVQPQAPRTPAPSSRARAEAQPVFRFEPEPAPAYEPPPLSLLASPATIVRERLSDEALEENARMLENVLDDYGVKGEIVSVRPGPVVTMYELEPAPGLKASRVIGLADDIARSMSALSARVSTVPGRSVIGIELPNARREKVLLREILASRDFGDGNHRLPLALGKDIGGGSIVVNLAKMPHLLIAGTTGSGKSVAINTMILSLLYKLSPEECRLIMIDPKMLELSVYDGIPHLLSPVVTDPKKAIVALKWTVGEMEERYRKMSKMGVRNIEGYNGRVEEALSRGEMFTRTVQTGFDDETGAPVFEHEEFEPKKLPYIVVVVDEMADLMMVAGKEIEACIQRLAQMARASGIHLIMATQRPSVDVITGTIKANFPTRISFQVTSKIDSRTILGEQGAEQLLGMGDMLYMAGGAKITRIHGPFCSDEEVEEIVNHLKSFGPPEYLSGVLEGPDEEREADIDAVLGLGGNTDGEDALYDSAVAVVLKDRKVSTSYIQRKLGIGYNKAARLVEQMEEEGLVSAANHVGKREILVPEQ